MTDPHDHHITGDVRLGVLGAAEIVKGALLEPAAGLDGVTVAAIAARDVSRAREYAAAHAVPRVLASYDELLGDTGIDAVYVPTPAALHGFWTRRALEAGKHVLVEKPFTANADEAAEIAALAQRNGLVVMEAFHSRHHPMWNRLRAVLRSDAIGGVRRAEARFLVPIDDRADIRWQLSLGGGALMDLGVYPVTLLRHLFGEPVVRAATAADAGGVDAAMTAELRFPGGIDGRVVASMRQEDGFAADLEVTGSAGTMEMQMPYHPQWGGLMTVTNAHGTTTEAGDERSSYSYMLQTFRDAVRNRAPVVTDAAAATATMRVVDGIYRAAGMAPRQPLAPA